jgi:hypothetical protein
VFDSPADASLGGRGGVFDAPVNYWRSDTPNVPSVHRGYDPHCSLKPEEAGNEQAVWILPLKRVAPFPADG